MDSKEIQPVNPKGTQPWIFVERTYAEGEAPNLWPPDAKILLTGKDPDAGKDWKQKNGVGEDKRLDSITNPMDINLSKFQEIVKDRGVWHAAVHEAAKNQAWLRDKTTTKTEDFDGPDSYLTPKERLWVPEGFLIPQDNVWKIQNSLAT